MKLISHRGNLTGPKSADENSPALVEEVIFQGYDVEVDVRVKDNRFWLGHDEPQYMVSEEWIKANQNYVWYHAKDLMALTALMMMGVNCFWHNNDKYTLTSKGVIWAYPGSPVTGAYKTVSVLPEVHLQKLFALWPKDCYGVCSDHIGEFKDYLNRKNA